MTTQLGTKSRTRLILKQADELINILFLVSENNKHLEENQDAPLLANYNYTSSGTNSLQQINQKTRKLEWAPIVTTPLFTYQDAVAIAKRNKCKTAMDKEFQAPKKINCEKLFFVSSCRKNKWRGEWFKPTSWTRMTKSPDTRLASLLHTSGRYSESTMTRLFHISSNIKPCKCSSSS